MFARLKGMGGMKGHGALVLRHDHSITNFQDCHEAIKHFLRAITVALGLRPETSLRKKCAPVIRDRTFITTEFGIQANA